MMKMKLMTGLAVALMSTAAMAADLPRRTDPVAPVMRAMPTFTWTGFYAGVNAGYGFGSFTGSAGNSFKDPGGFVGGGQLGYNYQVGSMVYGLEADLDYTDLKGRSNAAAFAGGKDRVNYIGTMRGRLGYAVDRFLPYVTGGFAYGGSKITVPGVGSSNPVNTGYALGAGVEYALTNTVTARVEGLYVDLMDKKVLGDTAKNGAELGIVRAGLNVKF